MTNQNSSILKSYKNLLGDKVVQRVEKKANKIKGKKVLNINSTKFGGGVAEILTNMLPLYEELGIHAEWKVFTAPEQFFNVSKKMHNALQGNRDISFSQEEIELYIGQAKSSYEEIEPDADFIVVHDPQPCPIIQFAENRQNKWIWRCHIDTANPNPQAWDLIAKYLPSYDALIFTKKNYAPSSLHNKLFTITPSIDPFSLKNRELTELEAKKIVEKFVPLDKALVTQISRFDPWKDPLGVIDAYRIVKKKVPVRLALIGSLASDDPEGIEWLEKVKKYAEGDPDIHILTNLDNVADLEVNAFQQVSDVILQKSIKEGFGLTVTEALWKKTPVIGGNVGGIKLQIDDGRNGFLVSTIDEAAEKTLFLLKHPDKAKKMGTNGHEKVKEKFLLLQHVEHYIDLFNKLQKN